MSSQPMSCSKQGAARTATPSIRKSAAFTLVELLTVIAIIAILAAIIFPVFSTIRENTRRANCISNMQKLYQATRQFELDNRRYPEYLFGPVLSQDGTVLGGASGTPLTMQQAATLVSSTVSSGTDATEAQIIRNAQRAFRNSLFPEYINDLNVYKCPNNGLAASTNDSSFAVVTRLEKQGTANVAAATSVPYYRFDSYDANPTINSANGQLVPNDFRARYSRVWFPLLDRGSLDALPSADRNLYRNQLVFSNPSSDTYITMCTYHAQYSKIIVLWLNGQAKVLDVRKLANVPGTTQGGVQYDYDVFRLTPTNN
ncbi:MAG: hypothetical protein OHK0029_18630 [Armatimonadaceae bacterium]